jgi:hypothetical protein
MVQESPADHRAYKCDLIGDTDVVHGVLWSFLSNLGLRDLP